MNKKEMQKDEIHKFKLVLFGKDVLSIIESYNPEGLDQWYLNMKQCNTQFLDCLYWNDIPDTHHGLMSTKIPTMMFNYRHIHNYYPKIFYNEISTGKCRDTFFLIK